MEYIVFLKVIRTRDYYWKEQTELVCLRPYVENGELDDVLVISRCITNNSNCGLQLDTSFCGSGI